MWNPLVPYALPWSALPLVCMCLFFRPPPPRVRVGEALRKGLYLALQMVAGGAHETPAHTPRPHPG